MDLANTHKPLKLFIWGFLMILLGIIAIAHSTMTTLISVILLGTLLLIGGIVVIVDAFTFWWSHWRGFFLVLLSGILYTAAGLALIENPIFASVSLTLLLGAFYLIVGFFRVIFSATSGMARWGWGLFSGLIAIALGILILTNMPESGLFFIGLFIGIDLIFAGWAYIMIALAASRR